MARDQELLLEEDKGGEQCSSGKVCFVGVCKHMQVQARLGKRARASSLLSFEESVICTSRITRINPPACFLVPPVLPVRACA